MTRPERLVVVVGTGTEVGKTHVTVELAQELAVRGRRVAARKPAQSFTPEEGSLDPTLRRTDADLLGAATGEPPTTVCPAHRWYPVPLAPPMAARRLDLPPVHLADLVAELRWPAGVDVGLVETAGGVRSPQALDGDAVALIDAIGPDLVLLVADAGLGTLNLVRLCVDACPGRPIVVHLNRFDPEDRLHVENADWLVDQDGCTVTTSVETLAAAVA